MTHRDYAILAQEAYSAPPDIGKEDSASRAIVRETDAGLVVAFPGSNNLPCWVADLDAMPMDVAGMGSVHRGFYEAWQAISVDVLAAIDGRPAILVGHSLGGAIALLAAAAMTVGGNAPLTVYAFEPPRVSYDMTIRVLLRQVPLHLYQNGSSPVTDLPLGGMHPWFLTHIGRPASVIPRISDHFIENVIPNVPID
jgi:hypothetical protein